VGVVGREVRRIYINAAVTLSSDIELSGLRCSAVSCFCVRIAFLAQLFFRLMLFLFGLRSSKPYCTLGRFATHAE
jgi:hypothetical protein